MKIKCPKCGHERLPEDQAPEWQCPRCGVAYNNVFRSPVATPSAAPVDISASVMRDPEPARIISKAGMRWFMFALAGTLLVGFLLGKRSALPQLQLLSLECRRVSETTLSAVGEVMNIGSVPQVYLSAVGEFRRGDGAVIETNRVLLDVGSLEAGHKAAFKVSGYDYGQGGTCRVFFVDSAERVVPHAAVTVATGLVPPVLPTDR